MPRRIPSLMAATAAVAVILGAFIATGRWYRALDEMDRISVDVARAVLLIVSAVFAILLTPFLVADWIQDRRREAERRAATMEGRQ